MTVAQNKVEEPPFFLFPMRKKCQYQFKKHCGLAGTVFLKSCRTMILAQPSVGSEIAKF